MVHLHQSLDARVYQELGRLFYASFRLGALPGWFHDNDIGHAILPRRYHTLKTCQPKEKAVRQRCRFEGQWESLVASGEATEGLG
jgi:hypothetical protein